MADCRCSAPGRTLARGPAEYASARRFLLGLPHAPPLDEGGKPIIGRKHAQRLGRHVYARVLASWVSSTRQRLDARRPRHFGPISRGRPRLGATADSVPLPGWRLGPRRRHPPRPLRDRSLLLVTLRLPCCTTARIYRGSTGPAARGPGRHWTRLQTDDTMRPWSCAACACLNFSCIVCGPGQLGKGLQSAAGLPSNAPSTSLLHAGRTRACLTDFKSIQIFNKLDESPSLPHLPYSSTHFRPKGRFWQSQCTRTGCQYRPT